MRGERIALLTLLALGWLVLIWLLFNAAGCSVSTPC